MRQLEQAEIYFDIEQELATRLAEVEGGKAITKKSHARSAVMNRRHGDVALITRVTTPSGIRMPKPGPASMAYAEAPVQGAVVLS